MVENEKLFMQLRDVLPQTLFSLESDPGAGEYVRIIPTDENGKSNCYLSMGKVLTCFPDSTPVLVDPINALAVEEAFIAKFPPLAKPV